MAHEFNLEILTPTKTFFQGKVTLLNLEIIEGRIGIMAKRQPLVSAIKTSQFSIIENERLIEGVIIGGILYMDGKETTIVTSRVKWYEDVNVSFSKKRLAYHQNILKTTKLKPAEKADLEKKIKYYKLQLKKK